MLGNLIMVVHSIFFDLKNPEKDCMQGETQGHEFLNIEDCGEDGFRLELISGYSEGKKVAFEMSNDEMKCLIDVIKIQSNSKNNESNN